MNEFNLLRNTEALIIFVKNPVPGQVKTRLARHIGNDKAAAVYRQLLKHTESVTRPLDQIDKFVYYADAVTTDDIWDNRTYQKRLQQGNDLGERMANAFGECFRAGYTSVVIIGSDCLDLRSDLLEQAFELLTTHDVVVGPATDGGYYLLGMKQLYIQLFLEMVWSTSTVLAATMERIASSGLNVALLEKIRDIDELEDYERIKDQLEY